MCAMSSQAILDSEQNGTMIAFRIASRVDSSWERICLGVAVLRGG